MIENNNIPQEAVQPVSVSEAISEEVNPEILEYDKKKLKRNNTAKASKVLAIIIIINILAVLALSFINNIQTNTKRSCLDRKGSECGSYGSATPMIFCDSGCKQPGEGIVLLLYFGSIMALVCVGLPLIPVFLITFAIRIVQDKDLSNYKKKLENQGILVE